MPEIVWILFRGVTDRRGPARRRRTGCDEDHGGIGELVLADDLRGPARHPGDDNDEDGSDQDQEHFRKPLPAGLAPVRVSVSRSSSRRDSGGRTIAIPAGIEDQSAKGALRQLLEEWVVKLV